jgi:hypothetical protein
MNLYDQVFIKNAIDFLSWRVFLNKKSVPKWIDTLCSM